MEGDPNVGSSSSSIIKKGKKPSPVWNEMIKYQGIDGKVIAQCKHCKKEFDGSSKKGTTHLKNHLERCPANRKRKRESDGRDGYDQHQSPSPSIKTKELTSLIKEKSVRDLVKHFSRTEGDTSDEEREDLDPSVLNSRKDEILQLYQEEKEKLCQFLNNLSCRFTLQLVCRNTGCLLEVNYIDDFWERQSKIISFWEDPLDDFENLVEAVKQSCLDWKIDTNICFLLLVDRNDLEDERSDAMVEILSGFSQRRSLSFASCLLDADYFVDYIDSKLGAVYSLTDWMEPLEECADYVDNKSTSDKLITSDKQIQLYSAAKEAISEVTSYYGFRHLLDCFETMGGLKEVFSEMERLDSDFRSINLTKQKWDEVTATFEHCEFMEDVIHNFLWEARDIPIIVDLPYVHNIYINGSVQPPH